MAEIVRFLSRTRCSLCFRDSSITVFRDISLFFPEELTTLRSSPRNNIIRDVTTLDRFAGSMALFFKSRLGLNSLVRGWARIYFSNLKGTKEQRIIPPQDPDLDEEIQPYWRALERRVMSRKARQHGKSGRIGLRISEEDFWLEAGLYDPKDTV
jgi:hypothetical protein